MNSAMPLSLVERGAPLEARVLKDLRDIRIPQPDASPQRSDLLDEHEKPLD